MKRIKNFTIIILITLFSAELYSQEREELIPFADMEQWTVRHIKESILLGGKTKTIYVLAPTDTIDKNEAFDYSRTPWGISNAYANVMGVEKAANTTAPEKRDSGYCARLDTRMETVKVLGMVNVRVAIAGTLFLGSVIEPIRSANDPYGCISFGIPFNKKPKALVFDIKANISPEQTLTKALGVFVSEIEGHDEAQIYLYLQKRWEDEKGNIFAKRIGTIYQKIDKSIPEWENNKRFEILYGDITQRADFKPIQGLLPAVAPCRALNSKGKLKEIQELEWGTEDDEPTHLMIMFSSGCYQAFYGHLGNSIWIDNIRLVYQ